MEILKKKLNNKYIRLNLVFMCLSFGSLGYTMLNSHSHFRECLSISMLFNTLIMLSNAFYHKYEDRQRDYVVCLISAFIVLCVTIFIYFY